MSSERDPDQVTLCEGQPHHSIFRYRKRSLLLLLFYIPLLVIPWVLTCILSTRRVRNGDDSTQYFPPSGLAPNGVDSLSGWVTAIRTLNGIASVATVPVISALLAQAAVVYTQRRKANQKTQHATDTHSGWSSMVRYNCCSRCF